MEGRRGDGGRDSNLAVGMDGHVWKGLDGKKDCWLLLMMGLVFIMGGGGMGPERCGSLEVRIFRFFFFGANRLV